MGPGIGEWSGRRGAVRASGSGPGGGERSGRWGWVRASGSGPGVRERSGWRGAVRAAGSGPSVGEWSGRRGAVRAAGSGPGVRERSRRRGAVWAGSGPGSGERSGRQGVVQVVHSPVFTASFAMHTVTVDRLAIFSAVFSVSSISWSAAMTRLTRPETRGGAYEARETWDWIIIRDPGVGNQDLE